MQTCMHLLQALCRYDDGLKFAKRCAASIQELADVEVCRLYIGSISAL